MFHFSGFRALFPIWFGKRRRSVASAGLPHSEISGSKRICRSPKLIAACHVLHRLLAPRHPLCALRSLIPSFETSFTIRAARRFRRAPFFCCRKSSHVCLDSNILSPRRRALPLADARGAPVCVVSLAVFEKNSHFSMRMSKSGPSRARRGDSRKNAVSKPRNGGPDRTRTYDPRLIKAVL